ncbi:MAG: universal stress protein, partial [Gammaproteobacteria bacterium]
LLREAGELIHEKVGVRTDAVWGHPADEVIIAEAIARKADLVVKEVTSESQLQRLLFSSSDWQLARNCPVPVMLVNEHSSSYPQRILVALDVFDEHGKPASLNHELIRNALGVAYQCDAQVHVIHVFDPTPLELAVPGVDQLPYDHELLEKVRDDHRVALTAFAEEYGIPEDRLHFLEGNTDLALSETVARLHADLLVMGAVKRSVIGRLFVGSTTERVLGRVDCDLLLVKAPAVADEIIEEHEERIRHLESSSRKRAG